jgi:hypothetical protein
VLSWLCVRQVDELRCAGASEVQRRRSVEVMLKQAASLFRKELASKSDEVAALQVGSHREHGMHSQHMCIYTQTQTCAASGGVTLMWANLAY